MLYALFISLIAVFAAWTTGAAGRWVALVPGILVLSAVATVFAGLKRNTLGATARSRAWDRAWGLPLLVLAIFLVVQAVNASHVFSPVDKGLTTKWHVAFLPRSVDARTTWLALAGLSIYAAMFWTVRVTVSRQKSRRVLQAVLVTSGFGMAVAAVAQRIAPGSSAVLPVTGVFVNENSYAAFSNLLMPVALAMGRRAQVEARMNGAKSHPGHLLYLMAAVMMLSVFVSGSKAGALVCIGILAAWLVMEARARRAGEDGRKARRASLLVPAAVALALVIAAGTTTIVRGWPAREQMEEQVRERRNVYATTLRMFGERRLFGTGAGTFACAFPYYQGEDIQGFYRYAHSDWLQYLAELGVVGFALLAAFVAGILRVPRRGNEETPGGAEDNRNHYTNRAMLLALCALGLHSLVDFPLHVPAVALHAAVWAGLLGSRRRRPLTGIATGHA